MFVEDGDHLPRFAFQKLAGLLDALAILLGADLAQAHRHLIRRRFQLAFRRRAPAEREHAKFFAHEIQCLPQRSGMRVGAEVAAPVVLFEAAQAKARPFFRKIDSDHEEPFVVAERDVVAWPIFLDQLTFQQNRFRFAAHRVRFKIPCCVQHSARFQVGLRHFGRHKV